MPSSSFREDFLHYIWQHQKFDKSNLLTCYGDKITVISQGFANKNAGPDFYNCKLIIKEIEWHGTVEVHYKSSDWNHHAHAENKAYNNVVLHLVWDNDADIWREDGTQIPTLELKNRIDPVLITKYKSLIDNSLEIPCANLVSDVDDFFVLSMLEKTIVERLETKSKLILDLLYLSKNDWEETCYQWLGKCFGFKINSDPFSQLCRLLPYSILKKYRTKLIQLEALIFGVAGFLDDDTSENEYIRILKQEFKYLSQKHSITKRLDKSEWKFLRLRPANFPTIRLAQFAAFLHKTSSLYDFVFDSSNTVRDYSSYLKSKPSEFWESHYHFKELSVSKLDAKMGNSSIENIIINAVVPLRFAHALYLHVEEEKESIVEVLRKLKPDKNAVVSKFTSFKVKVQSAYESQGLLQLHNQYCSNKKCLSCAIGVQIIQKNSLLSSNG